MGKKGKQSGSSAGGGAKGAAGGATGGNADAKPAKPAKRARGHRQRGAGAVRVARAAVARGGTMVEQWQRLPTQLLQEFCQREKRPKPRYLGMGGGGHRMKVIVPDAKKKDRDLAFAPEQRFDTDELAKEHAALLALTRLQGNLPLERKLPEPYKTVWMETISSAAGAKGAADGSGQPQKLSKAAAKRQAAAEARAKKAEERKRAIAQARGAADDEPAPAPAAASSAEAPATAPDRAAAPARGAAPAAPPAPAPAAAKAPPASGTANAGTAAAGSKRGPRRVVPIPKASGPLTSALKHASRSEARIEREERTQKRNAAQRKREAFKHANRDMKVQMGGRMRGLLEQLLSLGVDEGASAESVMQSFASEADARDGAAALEALGALRGRGEAAAAALLALGFGAPDVLAGVKRLGAAASEGSADEEISEAEQSPERIGALGRRLLHELLLCVPEARLPVGFEPKETVRVSSRARSSAAPAAKEHAALAASVAAALGFEQESAAEAAAHAAAAFPGCGRALRPLALCVLAAATLAADAANDVSIPAAMAMVAAPQGAEGAEEGGAGEDERGLGLLKDEFEALLSIMDDGGAGVDFQLRDSRSGEGAAVAVDGDGGGLVFDGVDESAFDMAVATLPVPAPGPLGAGGDGWKLRLVFAPGTLAAYPKAPPPALLVAPTASAAAGARTVPAQALLLRKALACARQEAPMVYDLWLYAQEDLAQDLASNAAPLLSTLRVPKAAAAAAPAEGPSSTPAPGGGAATAARGTGPKDAGAAAAAPPQRKGGSGGRRAPRARKFRDAFFDAAPAAIGGGVLERRSAFARSSAGTVMASSRRRLPSAAAKEDVVAAVRGSRVVLISGETGCGKTTQIPQFILEAADEEQRAVRMVCTQPRRIAAVGVAERVAEERCGSSPAADCEVGYKIRGDSKCGAATRLLFCTTGVLLRRLQEDKALEQLTHVIVDEVHERSVDGDFLLALLRDLLLKREGLKVILMSATVDAEKMAAYFRGRGLECPVLHIPGFTHPISELYLDELLPAIDYRPRLRKKREPKAPRGGPGGARGEDQDEEVEEEEEEEEEEEQEEGLGGGSGARRRAEASTVRGMDLGALLGQLDDDSIRSDYALLARAVLFCLGGFRGRGGGRVALSVDPPADGSLLVFLPGVGEVMRCVREVQRLCGEAGERVVVLPLHGSLPAAEQRRVFRSPPKGQRKVVVCTNIAETSITIPDATVVIDTLSVKATGFDAGRNMASLRVGWCAQDASRQRRGRAGRVRPGVCLRLCSRAKFAALDRATKPEMLRVPLDQLVLQIRAMGLGASAAFLADCLDAPPPAAVEAAERRLAALGAVRVDRPARKTLREIERAPLSPLGRHLSRIPADAAVAKMLIYGALLGASDAILTAAAALSARSPFLSPGPDRAARAALQGERERLARSLGGRSDHLAVVAAFDAYREAARAAGRRDVRGWHAGRRWCAEHHLSGQRMEELAELRAQYRDALADLGFLPRGGAEAAAAARGSQVFRAALLAGLYPNLIRVVKSQQRFAETSGGAVEKLRDAREMQFFVNPSQRPVEPSGGREDYDVYDVVKALDRVHLHPSSVLFAEREWPSHWAVYHEIVVSERAYVRDACEVKPYALLLFGGSLEAQPLRGTVTVDGWVRFEATPRVIALVNELRRRLDEVLEAKLLDPALDVSRSPVVRGVVRLLETNGVGM